MRPIDDFNNERFFNPCDLPRRRGPKLVYEPDGGLRRNYPDARVAAIFADTQAEPKSVYLWLDWLEKQLPFPVKRITAGSLEERSLSIKFSERNRKLSFSGIPAFIKMPDGSQGLSPRQCTRDFKVDPITKAVNAQRRQSKANAVLWIGISTDEIWRAKPHRNEPRIINRFPLFETRLSRVGCRAWMQKRNFPQPPRSACRFCPYRDDDEWLRLKTQEPEEFAKAVAFEKAYQASVAMTSMVGIPFIHRTMKPLSEVEFDPKTTWKDLFNNECEGMCGV